MWRRELTEIKKRPWGHLGSQNSAEFGSFFCWILCFRFLVLLFFCMFVPFFGVFVQFQGEIWDGQMVSFFQMVVLELAMYPKEP